MYLCVKLKYIKWSLLNGYIFIHNLQVLVKGLTLNHLHNCIDLIFLLKKKLFQIYNKYII